MTFHGGFKEKILFDQWDTNTLGGNHLFLFKKNKIPFLSFNKPSLDLGFWFSSLVSSMKD
jgi:hypothetical protein